MAPWRRKDKWLPSETTAYDHFHDAIDRLFDETLEGFYQKPFWSKDERSFFNPQLDITENEKAYEVSVELPGLNESDIDLSFHHGVLTVRGKKTATEEKKEAQAFHRECAYGSFLRTIHVSEDVDPKQIKAHFKNGVLKMILPKTHEDTHRQRIEVKTG